MVEGMVNCFTAEGRRGRRGRDTNDFTNEFATATTSCARSVARLSLCVLCVLCGTAVVLPTLTRFRADGELAIAAVVASLIIETIIAVPVVAVAIAILEGVERAANVVCHE